ncbi:MAG: hypothetical protein M1830_002696 [Pleopsidium flavum]|nr:MAG: hypothetical protein M1830_002696 [Pleopsidium flavum]
MEIPSSMPFTSSQTQQPVLQKQPTAHQSGPGLSPDLVSTDFHEKDNAEQDQAPFNTIVELDDVLTETLKKVRLLTRTGEHRDLQKFHVAMIDGASKVEALKVKYSDLCKQQNNHIERLEAEMTDHNGTLAKVNQEIKERTEILKGIEQIEAAESFKHQSRIEDVTKLEAKVAQQNLTLDSIKAAITAAETDFQQRRTNLESGEAKAKITESKHITESKRLITEASLLKKVEATLAQKEESVQNLETENIQRTCELREGTAQLEVQRSKLDADKVVLLECVDILRRQTLSITADEAVARLTLNAEYIRLLTQMIHNNYTAAQSCLTQEKAISASYKRMTKERGSQVREMSATLTSLRNEDSIMKEKLEREQEEHAQTRGRFIVAQETCEDSTKRESIGASKLEKMVKELEETKAKLHYVNEELANNRLWHNKYESAQLNVEALEQQLAEKKIAIVQREATHRTSVETLALAAARADKYQSRVEKLETEAAAKDEGIAQCRMRTETVEARLLELTSRRSSTLPEDLVDGASATLLQETKEAYEESRLELLENLREVKRLRAVLLDRIAVTDTAASQSQEKDLDEASSIKHEQDIIEIED